MFAIIIFIRVSILRYFPMSTHSIILGVLMQKINHLVHMFFSASSVQMFFMQGERPSFAVHTKQQILPFCIS
jgi:hypothetical protein